MIKGDIVGKLMKNIDLVGYTPKMYYNQDIKFKTAFGGLMTLVLVILTVLATIGFGLDLFEKKKPVVLTNNEFIEPAVEMDQNTVIGYRLFYTGGKKIPDLDRLVDIFVLHSVFKPELSSAIVTRYETIKCNESDVLKKNLLNVTSLIARPEEYYCMPNNLKFQLFGKYGAPVNNHMHLRIGICKNTTLNNNKCFPDEVIREKMASFFVSFIYKDSYITSKDFESPVKYYLTSNTLKSSSYNFRQDAYLYKNISFSTDSGSIMPNLQVIDELQLDYSSSSNTADPKTDVFTNVIIGLNSIKTNYNRSYIKIQDISAQVGGLIKFFMVIFEVLLSFYSYVPFLENLYVKLLINPDHKVNERKTQNIISPRFSEAKINQGNSEKNMKLSNKIPFDEIYTSKRSLVRVRPKSYSFCETLFRCFQVNGKSKKYNYLFYIQRHYEKTFDISEIILANRRSKVVYDSFFSKDTISSPRRNNFLQNIDQANFE
jgi:hypothetical protein